MKKSRIMSETAEVCARVRGASKGEKKDLRREAYLRYVAGLLRKI